MRLCILGSLRPGGTEKYLQALAFGLRARGHDVTYLTEREELSAPDLAKTKAYLEENGVKIETYTVPIGIWRRLFSSGISPQIESSSLDFMIYGTDGGYPQYLRVFWPTRLVATIHYLGGTFLPSNIVSVWHISKWSAEAWREMGGVASDVRIVSHPIRPLPVIEKKLAKEKLGLEGKSVFGLHQRDEPGIFSEVPLLAYKEIENSNTAFVVIGGSNKYSLQAQELGLLNFVQLPHTSDRKLVGAYLSGLDVYCHGRRDGEVNSVSLAEAMAFGLPIVSHQIDTSHLGHVEQLKEIGFVARSIGEYSGAMRRLLREPNLLQHQGARSLEAFSQKYDFDSVIELAEKNLENLLEKFPKVAQRGSPLSDFAKACVSAAKWRWNQRVRNL